MREIPYREIIFGLEDSLVSTLGVVIGIAVGTNNRYIVILSALVTVIVESLSMGAGTYLSNKSQMELDMASGKDVPLTRRHFVSRSISDSLFMGISYLIGGFISVLPFFVLRPAIAIFPSAFVSVTALFLLGFFKGRMAKTNAFRSGLEMSLVSLAAALLGYFVGSFAKANLMKL